MLQMLSWIFLFFYFREMKKLQNFRKKFRGKNNQEEAKNSVSLSYFSLVCKYIIIRTVIVCNYNDSSDFSIDLPQNGIYFSFSWELSRRLSNLLWCPYSSFFSVNLQLCWWIELLESEQHPLPNFSKHLVEERFCKLKLNDPVVLTAV